MTPKPEMKEGLIITAKNRREALAIADDCYGEDCSCVLLKKGKVFNKYQSFFREEKDEILKNGGVKK